MKGYYLEIEKNNLQEALEAVELFEKIGYKQPIDGWNESWVRDNQFDCVYGLETGITEIHFHEVDICDGEQPITIDELRKMAK